VTDTNYYRSITGPEAETVSPIIIALGATEQHGPHLPLETDAFVTEAMAVEVAKRLGGLVAPTLTYGCRSQPVSGGGETFPGTISLSGRTYIALVTDVIRGFMRSGHREIILLNGHFENTSFAIEGATEALEQNPGVRVVVINWWESIALDELQEIFEGKFPGWEAEHAGVVETSLMLYLDSGRVRSHLISDHVAEVTPPPYTVIPERPEHVDRSGVLKTAHGASAAIGERIFRIAVQNMTALLRAEFATEDSSR
jgi:creatinine amidohydrolase